MRLQGKRAIVTGAAGALGTVLCRTLAREGADVAGLDLDGDGLNRTGELVQAEGRRWSGAAVDLTRADDVRVAVDGVVAEWGGVDLLLNGAGGGAVSPFHELAPEVWQQQLDRNLTSTYAATRAVLPSMLERQEGRIVNIASIAAVSGGRLVRNATAYAAAKAGVIGLTKALAIEVAAAGITVNAIAPGAQATPGRDNDTPERREALLAQIPTRKLGNPQHLADIVVFFAAPESENITGVVLPVDGGHSI